MTAPRVDLREIEQTTLVNLQKCAAVTAEGGLLHEVQRDLAACLAALREAREVLAYYADEAQYIPGIYGYETIWPIELDKGKRAEAFLASITDGEPGPAKEGT